jgi:hypothetical protein
MGWVIGCCEVVGVEGRDIQSHEGVVEILRKELNSVDDDMETNICVPCGIKGIEGWCAECISIDVAFRTVEAIPRVEWKLRGKG